jgi:hypothetical protein
VIWQIFTNKTYGEKFIINGGNTPFHELITQISNRLGKRPPRIKLSPALLYVLAVLEDLRSRITGSEPLITLQSAKVAKENFYYSSEKVIKKYNLKFRDLQNTLDWCCSFYRSGYSNNN